MSRLDDLLKRAALVKAKMDYHQAEVDLLKSQLTEIQRESLPDVMQELGVENLEQKDGTTARLKTGVTAKILEGRKDDAFGWLIRNGYEHIIKNTILVEVPRDTPENLILEASAALAEALRSPVSRDLRVHPSTLKSQVAAMLEQGITPPPEFFETTQYRYADIKWRNKDEQSA